MSIFNKIEFEHDLNSIGIKKEWYDLVLSNDTILIYNKYYDEFFDKFKKIGIVANINVTPEDLNKIGGNTRWIILGTAVGYDYNRGAYTYKVIDGFDKKRDIEKNERPLVDKSQLLRNLIRSELKKELESRGIKLDEYVTASDTIEGKFSDIVIGTTDSGKELTIGIRAKGEATPLKYVVITREEAKRISDSLSKFL
jgi:hypothetical protein